LLINKLAALASNGRRSARHGRFGLHQLKTDASRNRPTTKIALGELGRDYTRFGGDCQ
jgi:hypothetical protein